MFGSIIDPFKNPKIRELIQEQKETDRKAKVSYGDVVNSVIQFLEQETLITVQKTPLGVDAADGIGWTYGDILIGLPFQFYRMSARWEFSRGVGNFPATFRVEMQFLNARVKEEGSKLNQVTIDLSFPAKQITPSVSCIVVMDGNRVIASNEWKYYTKISAAILGNEQLFSIMQRTFDVEKVEKDFIKKKVIELFGN